MYVLPVVIWLHIPVRLLCAK